MNTGGYVAGNPTNRPVYRFPLGTLHVIGRLRPKRAPRFLLAPAVSFAILLLAPLPAGAWKPTHHIHTGNEAIREILDGYNRVTINERVYNVDSKVAQAIRNNPDYYRAGCAGPDGFPDIAFGQMIIHPDWKKDRGTYTHEWLQHIYSEGWRYYNDHSADAKGQQALAFTYGFLTHAAGDLWGHTLINSYAGGAWPEIPEGDITIAIRHIIVESYIANRVPPTDLSIALPHDFLYRTFIGNATAKHLASASSIPFGIPFFLALRDRLVSAKNDIGRCEWWEWALPGYDVICPLREGMMAYLDAWIDDIDAGLAAWPERMGEISKKLLIDGEFGTAKTLLEEFAYDHLLGMYGVPDFVGGFLATWAGLPDWVKDMLLYGIPISNVSDMIQFVIENLIENTFGISFDELKDYFTNPERFINGPAFLPSGTSGKLNTLMAVRNGAFDPDAFAANSNTIVLAKMILLDPQRLNQLLFNCGVGPLYGDANPVVPVGMRENVMLGFIRSLDGDHQWRRLPLGGGTQHSEGMPLWTYCQARSEVFRVLFADWENSDFPEDPGEECMCGSTWYVDARVGLSGDGRTWETAFTTIQEGIDAACNDDMVIVASGTFYENISFSGSDITLQSTDPMSPAVVAETIIDGRQSGSVVTFSGTETQACVLSGFTIRNGNASVVGSESGGGVFGGGAHATIRNSRITANSATYGGGLYACDGTIENNTIMDNEASEGGGLMSCQGIIQGNTIDKNSAELGGGLHACHGTIERNRITGNRAGVSGGGLNSCRAVIRNNIIAGNGVESSVPCGGGGLNNCDGRIENNTIVGNWAFSSSGSYVGPGLAGCHGTIQNCIVWGNRAPGRAQVAGSVAPTYCCIEEWAEGGEGNINADPLFVDADGSDDDPVSFGDNDYRTSEGSPCIDGGKTEVWMGTGVDLDGHPRVSGGAADMGAYENAWSPRFFYVDGSVGSSGDGRNWDTAFKTIQQGIDHAYHGATVIVAAGIYLENIRFNGKNITLRTVFPPYYRPGTEGTIIDGRQAGSVVTFSGTETEACLLLGFTIRRGKAERGGGIMGNHTHATIRNNIIRENSADVLGGGVHECYGAIVGNTITENSSEEWGGGLSWCLGTIEKNTITANSAAWYGGGLYGCEATIQRNTIRGNWAEEGGGLSDCRGTIQLNAIVGNAALLPYGRGGGLEYCGGTIQLNIVAGNSADSIGGGLYACSGAIRNNTIVGNGAGIEGGGLYRCFQGTILNCILWGNTAPSGAQVDGGSAIPTHCCIEGWTGGGQGNVASDPQFVDLDGADDLPQTFLDNDYRISLRSPCIDAGVNEDWMWTATDLDQQPRVLYGGFSMTVDMGAYERAWKPHDNWYVDDSVSWPGDGTTPETAFKTIQKGIDAAYDGETVIVLEGNYVENIRFNGRNVVVRSTAPGDPSIAAKTIIDGNQAGPVVRFSGSETEACVFYGFTVRNGRTAGAGGGIVGGTDENRTHARILYNVIGGNWASSGAGVAYCDGAIEGNTLTGNEAMNGGGLAYCDGRIEYNRIRGNCAEASGGGLYLCCGTIRNNLITGNRAALGGGLSACSGIVENNTVAVNSAGSAGGGLHECQGAIRSCIVWGNSAPSDGQVLGSSAPTYCCIQGWTQGGERNLALDPQFVDADGPDNNATTSEDNDYHLRAGSACVDAGKNEPWMWGAGDLDGSFRISGESVDMGPYERGCVGGATWYVKGSVAASGDGRTWESALKTIQEGIDRGCSGDTIVVAEGIYVENIVFRHSDIVLRSTDPLNLSVVAETIIDGNQAGSVVRFRGTETEACVLSGFTIRNGAAWLGGGVCGGYTQATIENNRIVGNWANRGGGLYECRGTIRNNTVTGNSVAWDGGGLSCCHGTIQRNAIADNTAGLCGGGLYDCDGTIENNTVTGNSAGQGGGLYACGGTIENNTVTGNAATCGGGLRSCDGMIQNCIVWGNTAPSGPQIESSSVPSFSCIEDWKGGGEGNSSLYPHFVDPIAGDYHLQSWSPCIDAGNPASTYSREPQPNGERINMGAYGNTPEAASKGSDTDADGLPDGWELDAFGNLEQGASGDPDGDRVPNIAEYRHGWNPMEISGKLVENRTKREWYSAIQLAVDEADDGDEVVVYPGIHQENINFMGKNIVLRSMDPLDAAVVASTILEGDGVSCVVTFSGAESEGCALSGFTIRNGAIGIYGGGSLAAIQNNTMTGNSNGGLVDCDGMILGNTITANSAEDGGGLSYCDGTIQDNTIAKNAAERYGGGLCYCNGTIVENTITENWAGESGGGLSWCSGTVELNMITANWTGRYGSGSGGGLHYCYGTIRNNTIRANSAGLGGGLYLCGNLIQNTIAENSADEGGGLYRCSGIQNNTITENSAGQHGGGLCECGSIENNMITGNEAAWGGGLSGCNTIENNTIASNEAGSGGGLYGCGTIRDDLIVGNSAPYGSGLYECREIKNNTIAGNSSEAGGGTLYRCTAPILNCIVWGNLPAMAPQFVGTQSDAPTYSCIQDWTEGGVGNIAVDPQFVDSDGADNDAQTLADNDYRLAQGSAGIDAGTNEDWMLTATDLDGNGRILRGSSSPTVDMGAYERFAQWYVDDSVGASGDGRSWATALKTIQEGIDASYTGDVVTVAQGRYLENIQFRGDDIILRSTEPMDRVVVAATIIDGNNAGSVVSFAGTETEACMLWGFTLRNGHSAGSGGGIQGRGARATLRFNTIGGNSAEQYGGGLCECDGTIENNAITGNSARYSGGGLYACDGTIRNNMIAGNWAENNEGGGLHACNGTIENNTVTGNSAQQYGGGLARCDGTIRNNTVAGNSARYGGGGLYDCNGVLQNCILWGNTAPSGPGPQIELSSLASFSCIEDWSGGGEGNISLYPHFADPDVGAYHLQSWSPCVDAGDPASSFSEEPEPNGGRIDMGAYGNTAEAASKSRDVDADGLPDDWELDAFGSLVEGAWGDPDGDFVSNMVEFRDGWDPMAAMERVVQNRTEGKWYPGIQVALNAADAGDELVVYPGVYRENIGFSYGRDVVLRSVAPSDAGVVARTIIEGDLTGPVVGFAEGITEGCVLSGFTIRYGNPGILGYGAGATYRNHATIENNTITANTGTYGGGVYGCDGTIRNNMITGNSAQYGGGLFECNGTIQNNTITGNSAWSGGGGLGGCNGTIGSNMITGNSAQEYGGGLEGCNGTIRNNIIAGNSAQEYGGGLYGCFRGLIENNTITGNSAQWSGGALCYCPETAILNCIIWGNTTPQLYQSSWQLTYSCIQDWTGGGEGNIAVAPEFADPDGPDNDPETLADNDYQLLEGSPCIDSGRNEDWMGSAVDVSGNRRIVQGDSSLTVDMGAYEYGSKSCRISMAARGDATGRQVFILFEPALLTSTRRYELESSSSTAGPWVKRTDAALMRVADGLVFSVELDPAARFTLFRVKQIP